MERISHPQLGEVHFLEAGEIIPFELRTSILNVEEFSIVRVEEAKGDAIGSCGTRDTYIRHIPTGRIYRFSDSTSAA